MEIRPRVLLVVLPVKRGVLQRTQEVIAAFFEEQI
jgi:hypothetical protein